MAASLQILDSGGCVLVIPSKHVVRNYVPVPEPIHFGENFAVRLVSDHAAYRVSRFASGPWTCNCDAFKYSPKAKHSCKHIENVAPLVALFERLSPPKAALAVKEEEVA